MKNSLARTVGFFFSQYKKRTFLVVGLLILSGFAEAVGVASFLPLLQIILDGKNGQMPDGVASQYLDAIGLPATFPVVAGLIITAMTLKAFFLWAAMRYVSETVAKVADDLRIRFLQGLLQAKWSYFVTHALGTSLNAVATQTLQASTAFVSAARFLAACIQFLIYAVGALLVSWMVFAGGAIIGGLIVLGLSALVHAARRSGYQQAEIARQLLVQLADMLQGIKPLRAMSLENKFLDIMKGQSKGLREAQAEQLILAQSMRIFNEPLMMLAGVAGLYLAVTYGNLESSSLILMGVLFMRILTSMNAAQSEYQRLVSQEGALWDLVKTIETTEAADQVWPGVKPLPNSACTITFHNVSFSYQPDKPLLKNVDLEFPEKKMVALIGSSGSGKTSILDLICGFYRPESGSIEVSGLALDEMDLSAWRKSIGFVPQEVFLFNDSVFENVRIGRDVAETEILAAIDAAGARSFIDAMPEGIYSSVGENGRKLSGGQRQRIAIARALVGKPKFLLLDEATSALDTATEENLLKTLKELSSSVTVVFVSHNKGVLSYADIVYQIAPGEIVKR